MQTVQNQARKEIEDADRQREQVAAAIIESEMKKVREKESKVDQQLKNIAERYLNYAQRPLPVKVTSNV